jgi:hypothetical protein
MPQLTKAQRAAKAPRKQQNTRSNTPPLFVVTNVAIDSIDADTLDVTLSENAAQLILSGNPPFTLPVVGAVESAVLDVPDNLLKLTFSAAVAGHTPLTWPSWMPQLRDKTGGWLAPGSFAVGGG